MHVGVHVPSGSGAETQPTAAPRRGRVPVVPPARPGRQRLLRGRAGAAAIGVLGESSPAEHPQ